MEEQYPYIKLDEYIIMPDHLHGIISIVDVNCRGSSYPKVLGTGEPPSFNKVKSLGSLIGAFKTISTKKVNQYLNTPGERFWQRNYYERVIRDDKELDEIRYYIRFNPDKTIFL